jgi:hypothetical protein
METKDVRKNRSGSWQQLLTITGTCQLYCPVWHTILTHCAFKGTLSREVLQMSKQRLVVDVLHISYRRLTIKWGQNPENGMSVC